MNMKPLALIATLALSFTAYAAGGHNHGTGSVEATIDGGQIRINNRSPRGAEVSILLPLVPRQTEVQDSNALPEEN